MPATFTNQLAVAVYPDAPAHAETFLLAYSGGVVTHLCRRGPKVGCRRRCSPGRLAACRCEGSTFVAATPSRSAAVHPNLGEK